MHVSHRGKEAARAFPIKEGGVEARIIYWMDSGRGLQGAHAPPITGRGTVASLVLSILLARHASFMQVAGGGGGKPGHR